MSSNPSAEPGARARRRPGAEGALKDDRIYIRTSREQKEVLARAARARHLHTTEFVLQVSLSAAEEVLAQEARILLSERDFAAFLDAINGPPAPPSERLLADVAAYKARHAKTDSPTS